MVRFIRIIAYIIIGLCVSLSIDYIRKQPYKYGIDEFIVFLIRKKLGLKNHEVFRFENQKTNDLYAFCGKYLFKVSEQDIGKKSSKIYSERYTKDGIHLSGVSLNWLLDLDCKVIKVKKMR